MDLCQLLEMLGRLTGLVRLIIDQPVVVEVAGRVHEAKAVKVARRHSETSSNAMNYGSTLGKERLKSTLNVFCYKKSKILIELNQ